MKINWKELARSPGYQSLKAAYKRDAHKAGQQPRPMRRKAELYAHFCWVINRAKHYAYCHGVSMEAVLDLWESQRDYWWLNFYQEGRQPKLASGKPRNVRPPKAETRFKRMSFGPYSPERYFKSLRTHRQREAIVARKNAGKKVRWSAARKDQQARIRRYRQQNL